ncbi:indole-3-glycerol phosphate synthase, partial [Pseudomonas donghuensis]|nr:indole-3-glycerol phosphate synthase [Pseudomonas donghuensis]
HFNGSTEYLKQIRSLTNLPIIRKDFIIDEYQVYEAKVIGADAILLIAAILDDKTFKKLYDLAYSLGLDVLCEVHDEE